MYSKILKQKKRFVLFEGWSAGEEGKEMAIVGNKSDR